MKYFGYAECSICKDQNGPWILENSAFICEDCYERRKKIAEQSNKAERKHNKPDKKIQKTGSRKTKRD